MKVRALTIGISLDANDFHSVALLQEKIHLCGRVLKELASVLEGEGYEVQTQRISLNSFEDWLDIRTNATEDVVKYIERIEVLVRILEEVDIHFCSMGCATSLAGIRLIPALLRVSSRLCCSAHVLKHGEVPDLALCEAAAESVLKIAHSTTTGLANFHFCTSFNAPANIPFFPAAFHVRDAPPLVTVGLECGELLFVSFHGVTDHSIAQKNLESSLVQACLPIENALQVACSKLNVLYGGIDASLNPGLSLPESVGFGIEQLYPYRFGKFGNLATISTITKAIKNIKSQVATVGYCGLMLPVMEDVVLAERAAETPSALTLRDLTQFSTVCGVGLDTVPVSGDISIEDLVGILMDLGTIAYRLDKCLSCRVLPIPNLVAGDMTSVDSPYLCNTRVFSIN